MSKSAMTKVMDLFRHRSNSAVSEADKRKAVSVERRGCGLGMMAKSDTRDFQGNKGSVFEGWILEGAYLCLLLWGSYLGRAKTKYFMLLVEISYLD